MIGYKYFLTISMVCLCFSGFAQQSKLSAAPVAIKAPTGQVWIKRVSRIVFLADTANTDNRKLRPDGEDKPLAELFFDGVQNGKITAYAPYDNHFGTALTKKQVMDLFIPKPDTLDMTDPVTGRNVKKIVTRDVNFWIFTKYRVLEEWTFDKQTGRTSIQIVGLAPMKEIYGENGEFRGMQSCYWLKYNDAKEILTTYEQSHADCNLALAVWKDYFSENEEK